MKYLLIALSLALTSTAGLAQTPPPGAADTAPAFKAHVLSRSEIDQLFKHPEQILVIDVRRPDEVATIGGFPVYLSIPVKDVESDAAWIPKGRRIVTVSNHAARAGKAADLLKDKGFDVVGAIGVQLYEKDGGTLTKYAPAPASTAVAAQAK
jgi:rhodanese-related sulfurtransferase